MYLVHFQEKLHRNHYDLNVFISEFGGMVKGFMLIISILMYPVTKFGYYRNLTKKLFLVSTKE